MPQARYVPPAQIRDYANDVIEPLAALLSPGLDKVLAARLLDQYQDEETFDSSIEWFDQVAARDVPIGPLAALVLVRSIRARVRGLEVAAVIDARRHGISWQYIGDALGITRQAAEKRWAWIKRVAPEILEATRR